MHDDMLPSDYGYGDYGTTRVVPQGQSMVSGTPMSVAGIRAPQPGLPTAAQPIGPGAWSDPRGWNPGFAIPAVPDPTIPSIIGPGNTPPDLGAIRSPRETEFQGSGGYTYYVRSNGQIEVVKPGTARPGLVITESSHPTAYRAIMAEFLAAHRGRRLAPDILQTALQVLKPTASTTDTSFDASAESVAPSSAPSANAAPPTDLDRKRRRLFWFLVGSSTLIFGGAAAFLYTRKPRD